MISDFSKKILNRRPEIKFTAPRSVDTIPEIEKSNTKSTLKSEKVDQLIKTLDNIVAIAESVEKVVADRAKNEILRLNIELPEDAMVAQAVARLFPDKAKNVNGFVFVDEITFDMYNECLQSMKSAGKSAGLKQQPQVLSENFKSNKTDFGGTSKDKRPEVNQSTIPFAPLNIPAFVAAGIPILFGMLFPLINVAIKKDVVAHTHPVIPAAPGVPVPSGPGIPVSPV